MATNWSSEEVAILKENIGKKKTPAQIAEMIGRSEVAVRLYCTRHGIYISEPLKKPLMVELLKIKFGEAEYFQPTREFYRKVGISQKRFSQLKQGLAQPTNKELEMVCREFRMNHEEYARLFTARQLSLFD